MSADFPSAATATSPRTVPAGETALPTILVFDSGLGGLTVYAEVAKVWPGARYVYAADDAGFPYGRLSEAALVARVLEVMGALIAAHDPALVVVACNTASTLVLPHLRAAWPALPFVGTVPAVKPAAAVSRSGIVAVIATPGTVSRDYTRALIDAHAAHCRVVLVGSQRLAAIAEAAMRGEAVEDEAIRVEIAPCFVADGERHTDTIVLACTHYPLLLDRFERLAPWPVTWIDPAAAIARQAARVLAQRLGAGPDQARQPAPEPGLALFTSGASPDGALARALGRLGLAA